MTTRHARAETICAIAVGAFLAACSGSDSKSASSGGTLGVGGAAGASSAIGGTSSIGGMPQTGGTLATAGDANTGGALTTGGALAIGGTSAAAGGLGTGGSISTGGTVTSIGGNSSTGGSKSAAGAPSMGGTASTGGSKSTAGASTAGGSASTGGSKATGGTSSIGGSTPGGAKASGGTDNAGGTKSTGGASAAGGTGGKPYKGVANSPCTARTNLNVAWYYNWMQTADAPCSSPTVGGEFVPMIWGHTGAEQTTAGITSAIASMVSRGNTTVLGFNEPDNTGQSNLTVATALSLWPAFNNPSIRVGSPATQANTTGVAWFTSFNTQINADATLRADFIAIHWYGWNAGSCDANANTLMAYIAQIEALPGNRPIWLTEWGCLNGSDNASAAVTQAHIAGAVAKFASHPRLERYAWYPWADAAHALNNSDGSLTTLGIFYASLPAYK